MTADRPKCLVELAGRPLLAWQLDALTRAGVDDVTIVTGYRADAITAGTRRVHNPRYADTNMVASLMCARDAFDGGDDVLIAYGDIVYEPRLVTALDATRSGIGQTRDQTERVAERQQRRNSRDGPLHRVHRLTGRDHDQSQTDADQDEDGTLEISSRLAGADVNGHRTSQ